MIMKRRRKGKRGTKGKLAGILDADLAFVILAVASMAVFDRWAFVGFSGIGLRGPASLGSMVTK
jgi:hypothetical protein